MTAPSSRTGATDREVEAATEFDVASVMLAMGMPLEREFHQLIEPTQETVLRLAQLIANARTAVEPHPIHRMEVHYAGMQAARDMPFDSYCPRSEPGRMKRSCPECVAEVALDAALAALLAEQPGGGR